MPADLGFDWDRVNTRHIARHGVTPEVVEEVFANDPADIGFETVEGEGRWTAVAIPTPFAFWSSSGR